MPIGEMTKCRCGGPMVDNGKGAFLCENCDGVQAQQRPPFLMERIKTKRDVLFELYWNRVVNNEYTDNTKTDPDMEPDEEEEEEDYDEEE